MDAEENERGRGGGGAGGAAPEDLLARVYGQLRAIAQQRLTEERAGHTLQATALVHEAYLRLRGGGREEGAGREWSSDSHFVHAAAEAMRRILIEHARSKGRVKRGGGRRRLELDSVLDLASGADSEEILAFDGAMRRLEEQSPDAAAVVRLRFYAGLSVEEAARALGVSARTVNRDWTYARAWLYRELEKDPGATE